MRALYLRYYELSLTIYFHLSKNDLVAAKSEIGNWRRNVPRSCTDRPWKRTRPRTGADGSSGPGNARRQFVTDPAVLILLSPLATAAPAPVGAILVGGSTNP